MDINASLCGLCAVLSQVQDGKERVIAYASRGLRGSECSMQNYSSLKLELLGLKWAVTLKFKNYLYGAYFTVRTDNNPLSHLNTAKLGAVEQRWVANLAPFNFNIVYRPGKANRNADGLSRQFEVDCPDRCEAAEISASCCPFSGQYSRLPVELQVNIFQHGGRRFKSRSSQFSLFTQIYLKSVPSQFPLWFIT